MASVKTLATVIERPYEANFREVTLTPKRDDTVVCQTIFSSISTGTDMKTYKGLQHATSCYYPLVPGYENMGVILEEGEYAQGLKKGDRVMINECRKYLDACSAWGGGTHIVHKDLGNASAGLDRLVKIPDNVTDEQAVLAYLANVSLKGAERFNFRENEFILVFGSGMIGVGAMQVLKILNPSATIICAEVHPYRQEIAKLFADHVITPDEAGLKKLADITNGRRADKIMECSGNPAVPGTLYKYLKDGGWGDLDEPGHIHLQGDYPSNLIFDAYNLWFNRNATITMSCAGKRRCKEQILQWISEGKFKTDGLPYEVWEAGKAKEAFEYQHKKGMECFKILFDWRNV
ncbi:MAG: zinc-binding dehydrogenase [Lentisphaeria bacterium]|nr:zinc-binding dehydrogenase [Lentisphaeria bacterium]MBR7127038.1 zinc-binding dehydrogenase [Lentisphaeria bacterium]